MYIVFLPTLVMDCWQGLAGGSPLQALKMGKQRADTWAGPYKLIPDKSDHSHSIVAGGLLLIS